MKKQMWFVLVAIGAVLLVTPASHAQLNSGPTTVALNATLAESLTLAVAPTTVTFTLVPSGTANGNAPVSITTTWVLGTTRASLNVYAYFSSTTALVSGAGTIIPTSKFNGQINGAGGYSAFTGGAGPFGANSKTVYSHGAFAVGQFNGNHTDTLGLQIDTTGLNLPAGAYTGTLNIQAQAI